MGRGLGYGRGEFGERAGDNDNNDEGLTRLASSSPIPPLQVTIIVASFDYDRKCLVCPIY